jgi:hypothetical protein
VVEDDDGSSDIHDFIDHPAEGRGVESEAAEVGDEQPVPLFS